MEDTREAALRLLRKHGHADAARVLAQCRVTLRHVPHTPRPRIGDEPVAEVQLHAKHEVISAVHDRPPPEGGWGSEIEGAIREALHGHFLVSAIQWVEEAPEPLPRASSG